MIYAYDKVYLRIAQRSLGEMLSYAVYDLGYELEDYYKIFLQSEYSMRFSKGDLFVITGMSGAELAIRVLDIPDDDIIMPRTIQLKARNIGQDGFWHITNGRMAKPLK